MRPHLDALLHGPYWRLPRLLDACSDRWAALRPRVRAVAVALAVVGLLLGVDARVRAAEARWGGPPRPALVAAEDLAVGQAPEGLVATVLPPGAVPDGALQEVPPDATLSLALPRGAVLTATHVDPRGPAAGLAPDQRAVPVPAEAGWGVPAGGWVDVWVLGAGSFPARRVAAARPVLEVRSDDGGLTALVGLAAGEVGPTTEGLAVGRVLLTHAPPPGPPPEPAPRAPPKLR